MSLRTQTLKNLLHCVASKSLGSARPASEEATSPLIDGLTLENHKENLRTWLLLSGSRRVADDTVRLQPSIGGNDVTAHPLLARADAIANDKAAFDSTIHLSPLTGGNSNAAFVVHVATEQQPVSSSASEPPLLLRVYGDSMQNIVDREMDVRGMTVASRHHLAPAIVAIFEWGRLEAFLDGFTTGSTEMWLRTSEPWHLEATATALRALHLRAVDAPQTSCAFVALTQRLLDRLRLFTACDDAGGRFVAEWAQEVQWLQEQCASMALVFSHNDLNPSNIMWKPADPHPMAAEQAVGGPISVSHVCPVDGSTCTAIVYLIDFEFSGWNYQSFDLGNTLCEMDYDYTEGGSPADAADAAPQWVLYHPDGDVPSATACISGTAGFDKPLARGPAPLAGGHNDGVGGVQRRCPFAPHLPQRLVAEARRVRGASSNPASGGRGAPLQPPHDALASHILTHFVAPYLSVPRNEITEAHLREVVLGMLCSHVVWGLWGCTVCADGIKDASNGSVAFPRGCSGLDYAAYAECRLREYDALKAWATEEGLA